MLSTSINQTTQGTHPAQFRKQILRFDSFEKRSFFESAILEFFPAHEVLGQQLCTGLYVILINARPCYVKQSCERYFSLWPKVGEEFYILDFGFLAIALLVACL